MSPKSVSQLKTAPRPEAILVLGRGVQLLDLLRLAVLRSDAVMAVAEVMDAATRRFVDHFAIEFSERAAAPGDLDRADAVLIALDDVAAENVLVRAARRSGTPVYVAGRPLVSDFTPLELLEQRPIASLVAA